MEGPARIAPAARAPGLVSIVVPTRDRADLLGACIDSIVDDAQPHEIVIVDNGSVEAETRALYAGLRADPRVRLLSWDKPFNFADLCNAGAEAASGETLVFLNNDVVFPEAGWIGPLVAWLGIPGIGAVGTKLVWPNGIVQHGGVRIGPQGLADHVGTTWWRDEPGPNDLNRIARVVDGVTAACLAMPHGLFREIGGFDGHRFPVAFNDVELCIRVQEAGRRIVWTPEPWAWHLESASRGDDDLPHKRARMEREAGFLRGRVAEWQAARHAPLPGGWRQAG
jgi:GT2 family glycosyltransferase